MTSEENNRRLAQGQIQIAIQRLAGKYPFHAKTLEKFDLRAQPDVGTMGVTVAGEMVQLLFSPDFVLSISLAELGGVLLHEVLHVALGHLLADPADFPDEWARTNAEEVTVNEFVVERLPGQPITLKQFPALPPMESTKERYERLSKRVRRPPITSPGVDCDATAGSQSALGTCQGQSLALMDNHSVWTGAMEEPDRAEATIRAVLQDVVSEIGSENVPPELQDTLKDLWNLAQDMERGDSPGGGIDEIKGSEPGHLNWVRLLRRYIGKRLAVAPDFARPPRRFPNLVGVIPGQRRRGRRLNIIAVIDTSGSVTPDLLELINAELARLAKDYAVTVVECDADIQDVYCYRPVSEVHGRGGTDFRPPLEPAFLRQHKPDLVIFFTDGFGPGPESPPRIPVVWCLTPGGEAPCTWGRVIQMES